MPAENTNRLRRLARIYFGFEPLDRRTYALAGTALVVLHYAFQAGTVALMSGHFEGPIYAVSPLAGRLPHPTQLPTFAWVVLALEHLTFVWAGTSMSMRRAIDAGRSLWSGLVFLLPIINAPLLLLLAIAPHRPPGERDEVAPVSFGAMFSSAVLGTAIGVAAIAVSVYWFTGYGATLFVVTPFVMGFVIGYVYNRSELHGEASTASAVILCLGLTSGALVLFAMEGLVCIAMAAPIALAAAIPGGTVGRAVARHGSLRVAHVGLLIATLPIVMGAESRHLTTPLREVATSIEIDAPPAAVWPHVVGFSDLPPPSELVFRLGIAHPRRARIEGSGIGAVRHCEFSTGAFVEPITRWEEPSRLSFDVVSQPHPMHEWSPYENVDAPHLVGNMRSKRGEFRLVALPGGRTRLEGSTWYELEMFPQPYWTLWSDALIHAIHTRVLAHIERLAEADAS